jgi:hypothetical protein
MGGPPGFGPPPAAEKSGPPVALLVGGGCGLLAVLGVIVLVIMLVVAGSSSADSDPPTASGGNDAPPTSPDPAPNTPQPTQGNEGGPDVMAGAVYKRVPQTDVEVPVPPGWREDSGGLYTFALSGDGDALLAFTTVSSVGEFNGRLQHATSVFRITDCNMGDAQRVNLGPDQLRSRLREGDCMFNGVAAHVATVLVESGSSAFPLVIYAVDKNANKTTETQALQTLVRMRRAR